MKREFDYVVVGSGLAGLYSALCASKYGKVALVTKDEITDSNSYNAQGGIAAVSDKDDVPQYHFEDTIVAGRGLCDHPSVNILVNEGPQLIRELIRSGMKFDVTESGELALGLEGGHHRRRILHAGGDATGRMVTSFVIGKVLGNKNIEVIPHCALTGILVNGDRCEGVRCWNFSEGCECIFTAPDTILASGGSAAIYSRSTNPKTTTGDGTAIAYGAGCTVEDMEFVQFHPTAIVHPQGDSFLVSEAVRGEGARLYNMKGERFMEGRHELAELAPRDVVAQNIDRQIRSEDSGYVWLSLAHLDREAVRKRFPTIWNKCLQLGIDMGDRIPVAPAAHYTVGGVCCDSNARTDIPHLYVCGEIASTGIMGANRLASNSLIECMVFGRRAINDTIAGGPRTRPSGEYAEKMHCISGNEALYASVRRETARIVSTYAGITRDAQGLQEGLRALEDLRREMTSSAGWDADEVYCSMCGNLVTTAWLIVRGALFRQESRGCHYRTDFPSESEAFHCHTLQRKGEEITKREVRYK